MATKYVAASGGSNGNPGTISQPYATVAYAVAQLTAGDTLYLLNGTYTGPQNVFISQNTFVPSGTSGNLITISGYPGDTVILQPPTGSAAIAYAVNPVLYMKVQNLIIDMVNSTLGGENGGNDGIYISDGTNNVFSGLEIKNCGANAFHFSSHNMDAGYNSILSCLIHDNGTDQSLSNPGYGLYISTSHNIVDGNHIYNNHGFGVQFNGPYVNNNIVRNNKIHDNYPWYPGGGSGGHSGGGVTIGSATNPCDSNLVYNNLIYNNGFNTLSGGVGIQVYNLTQNTGVYNNTIYNNNGDGIFLQWYGSGNIIRNNIVYNNVNGIIDHGDIVGHFGNFTSDHNITSDPSFTNAGANDFTLQSTSIAINAGVDVGVYSDYIGTTRPQGSGFDCGAYEFVGGGGGSTGTTKTYKFSNATSDLDAGGGPWYYHSLGTTPAGSDYIPAAANGTGYGYYFTVANEPGLSGANGDVTAVLYVSGAAANTKAKVRVHHVNSGGIPVASSPYSAEQSTAVTGILTFTITGINFGLWNTSDRYAVEIFVTNYNTSGAGVGPTFDHTISGVGVTVPFGGTATTTTYNLATNVGSYAIAGNSAGVARVISASSQSYSITGFAATSRIGKAVNAQVGTYQLSGGTGNTLKAYICQTLPGSYSVSGPVAALIKVIYVAATAGSCSISGLDAGLVRQKVINAAATSYTVSGVAAVPLGQRLLSTGLGAYDLAGFDATTQGVSLILVDGAAYSVSGSAASLLYNKVISTGTSAYSVSGSDAAPVVTRVVSGLSGSYSLTGSSATSTSNKAIGAISGSYLVSGLDAVKTGQQVIVIIPGSYSLTGMDAGIVATRLIAADAVPYLVSGLGSDSPSQFEMALDSGSFNLSGRDEGFTAAYLLVLDSSSYTTSGADLSTTAGSNFSKILNANQGFYNTTGSNAGLPTRIYALVVNPGSYRITLDDLSKGKHLPKLPKQWRIYRFDLKPRNEERA